MLASTSVGVVGVKSRTVFPDLLPFELEVVLSSQRRVQLAVRQLGALCRETVLSMPLFGLCIVVGMFVLANA